MIRRISTKLVLAVLGAVIVPFLGFAVFVQSQMGRMSRDVVASSLVGLANDLAQKIDRDVDEYRNDVQFLAEADYAWWAVQEYQEFLVDRGSEPYMRDLLLKSFDFAVGVKRHFELLLLVDSAGRLVVCNESDPRGKPFEPQTLLALQTRRFETEEWFRAGIDGRPSMLDAHSSDLLPPAPAPRRCIGFSYPVYWGNQPGEIAGVVLGLVDWRLIQERVATPALKEYFRGLGPAEYSTAYGWVWKSDANTILAHPDPELYGKRISEDLELRQLTEAALASDGGLYPPYEFRGEAKSAAFKHTKPPEQGGFDWVVGVGIDDGEILRSVKDLREKLVKATAVVLLVATLWTLVISRRMTQPILALHEHTRSVAAGDLDARVAVGGGDELAELGASFNEMTREIKDQRAKLVKAEKDAAWREMARQVAHDIKNPLTPVQLSVDLLRRAKQEQSPQFDAIFERTLDTISRQVGHLREIANDFHALTGALKQQHPRDVDAGLLVDDLLELNAAWGQEAKVRFARRGGTGRVFVDELLLRRVLQNLISNAIQASPEGGELEVVVTDLGPRVRIEVSDRGTGLSDEVRARLFEPYFTTRSTGTGLGLAIAKRAVEEMGGTIRLGPRADGAGTTAVLELPAGKGGAEPGGAPA